MEINNLESPLIADTSALVSLAVKTDHNHAPAVAAAEALDQANRPILLPIDVLSETINLLGKKSGKETARNAGIRLLSDDSQFLLIDTASYAYDAFEKFGKLPPSVSFIDCMVMAVADAYCTKDVFGFDKQFADAGYTRLTPSTDWTEAA
jgi:predicted nucleic acid-binding protein